MKTMTLENFKEVKSSEELRLILGPASERALNKGRPELTEMDRKWLAVSPFLLMGTSDATGRCDVSPKGDPEGFVKVLDARTIVIPERLGNRRADSFHNILKNPHVGLLFLIPGRGDTLRISGKARLVSEAPFFDDLIVKGHRPDLALVVDIEDIFFHCSKAFMRSDLWNTESWQPEKLPSRACIAKEIENTGKTLEELETYYGEAYRKGLYGG